jgi:hypothetical protein
MRRKLPPILAAFALLGFVGAAFGQANSPYSFTTVGFQQMGSLASATPLTVPGAAKIAEICVENGAIRYRDDGTAPTAAVGIQVSSSAATSPVCFQYSGPLSAMQMINSTGTPGVFVAYYR